MGVNICIYHVKGAQFAKKTVIKSQCDGEKCIKYNGEIMFEKDNEYMVYCTVIGLDDGTNGAPNFYLEYLFK